MTTYVFFILPMCISLEAIVAHVVKYEAHTTFSKNLQFKFLIGADNYLVGAKISVGLQAVFELQIKYSILRK